MEYSADLHCYIPIPDGSIRVLHLEPGSENDLICCSLQPYRLGDVKGRYDALSYTWGSGHQQQPIVVDGKTLWVQENLWRFLHELRSAGELDLWADAICIDQRSTEEKNQQVEQMHHIYRRSRTTRLWLSSPEEQRIGSRTKVTLDDLRTIMTNEYWKRLWILQEVILS